MPQTRGQDPTWISVESIVLSKGEMAVLLEEDGVGAVGRR